MALFSKSDSSKFIIAGAPQQLAKAVLFVSKSTAFVSVGT
jgi:hypothetical protein